MFEWCAFNWFFHPACSYPFAVSSQFVDEFYTLQSIEAYDQVKFDIGIADVCGRNSTFDDGSILGQWCHRKKVSH